MSGWEVNDQVRPADKVYHDTLIPDVVDFSEDDIPPAPAGIDSELWPFIWRESMKAYTQQGSGHRPSSSATTQEDLMVAQMTADAKAKCLELFNSNKHLIQLQTQREQNERRQSMVIARKNLTDQIMRMKRLVALEKGRTGATSTSISAAPALQTKDQMELSFLTRTLDELDTWILKGKDIVTRSQEEVDFRNNMFEKFHIDENIQSIYLFEMDEFDEEYPYDLKTPKSL
jgi:hypothetical protein